MSLDVVAHVRHQRHIGPERLQRVRVAAAIRRAASAPRRRPTFPSPTRRCPRGSMSRIDGDGSTAMTRRVRRAMGSAYRPPPAPTSSQVSQRPGTTRQLRARRHPGSASGSNRNRCAVGRRSRPGRPPRGSGRSGRAPHAPAPPMPPGHRPALGATRRGRAGRGVTRSSVRYGRAHPIRTPDTIISMLGLAAAPGGRPLSPRPGAPMRPPESGPPAPPSISSCAPASGRRGTAWTPPRRGTSTRAHPLELSIAPGDGATAATRHRLGIDLLGGRAAAGRGARGRLATGADRWADWTLVGCARSRPASGSRDSSWRHPAGSPGGHPLSAGRAPRSHAGRGSARPSAADRASTWPDRARASARCRAARPCAPTSAVNASSARAAARSSRSMPAPGQVPDARRPAPAHRRGVAGAPDAHLGGTGARRARVRRPPR